MKAIPFETDHQVSDQAIHGTIISISIAWHIPVLFSQDKADTVKTLLLIGGQSISTSNPFIRKSYKPKKLRNRQIFFLQGLPSVGPSLALRLLQTFGNINNIISATEQQLRSIEGIGKKKASAIREFLLANFR